jgi:hypothetical protein
MWKQVLALGLTVAILEGLPSQLRSEEGCGCSPGETKRWTFDGKEALAGWTVTGDVGFDNGKSREGRQGALRVGPGGKALVKLRDKDASGKVEIWVYDDATVPANAKAHRVGPRWGLVENDGNVLAAGILYADYLGGDEGYTATLYNGKTWFNQLFWLGVRRTPAGWHRWTFDFDPEAGLQVFHNGKELGAVDPAKVALKGFTSIAIWGDQSGGREQNIWVSNVTVTLGGPVKVVATGGAADPYDDKAVAADAAASRPVTLYTKDNPPRTPKLDDLSLKRERDGIRHHLDLRAARPRRPLRQWRLLRGRSGHRDRPRPQAALWQRDSQSELDPWTKSAPSSSGFATASCSIRRPRCGGLRQRHQNWFAPKLIREAARDDEARRFAGLHHQHAQGPQDQRPLAEHLRARRRTTTARPALAAVLTCVASRSRRTPSARPSATARQRSTWPAT